MLLPFFIFGQTVNVTTDRPDATYEAGESMNFIVTGGSGSANYVIHYDHGVTPALERGTIQLGGTIEIPFTLNEPGAVICLVVANDGLDVIGATFSPFDIEPYEDDPADFDAFWAAQKAKLAAVPLDPQLTPITTPNPNTTDFRISLGSIEGRRLYGYLSIPNGGIDLPAVITHSAFGVGPNLCVPRPEIADELGAISMAIWMHDGEPDTQVADAYEPMIWDNRDSIYFRYGVFGILRAMDYIQTMPEFRGEGIILNGVSEGGGMSLLTAGIDDRVTGVSASIFAHAEHTGFKYGKASGFPHYLQQAPFVIQGVDVDQVLEATKYYDVLRAAKRFEGPVLASIGYEDLTSIPMAQFGAYNQLKGPKTLIHKVEGAHQNPDEFFIGKFDFYRKWLDMPGQTNFHADAGADQSVAGSATLTGVVEKAGAENTSLPVEWTMVSGPAPATIATPTSRITTVNFTQDGEYQFRIRATDKTELTTTKTFYTFSDVVKISVGSVIAPCANAGGDADGDGICANEDCNDNNPNISQTGDACDDGNPNTNNDVIQADCSCAGTTMPPPNNNCAVSYQLDGNTLTVSQLTDTYNLINIYDRTFNIIQSCQDWISPCNMTEVFILPNTDLYFVQIQSFSDWDNQVCNIFEAIEILSIPGCENVTDGGEISGDEAVCFGETPAPITSDIFPSGGSGTMEYQWISSTDYCPFDISDEIPGATQSTYTPVELFETTYFRRLSRRAGCSKWDQGISNCIAKIVENCGNPTTGCPVDFSINATSVSFSNITAPIAAVKIIDSRGVEIFNCETPNGTPCPEMSTIQLTPEIYNLFILTAENWNQGFTCNIAETFQITTSLKQSNNNRNLEMNSLSLENLKDEFSVFPNPANDEINLIFGKNTPNGEVIIFNQMGQIVKRTAFAKNPISVSELPTGVYFIKVGSKTVKFIRSK